MCGMKKEMNNDFGVLGVALGIMSIIMSSGPGAVAGIVGLVFSMKQKKVGQNKWSRAGIILNWIGIILGIVATIVISYAALKYGGLPTQLPGA